jgi:hypothetical protein
MDVNGSWALVVDSPMGKQQFVMDLKEADGEITGTLTNTANKMSTDIFDASVEGTKMTLTFSTTVRDDTMSGSVKAGMFGKFAVSGTRQ